MTVPDTPPSEIQTLIDAHVDAFNSQNVKLFLSVFADDAIIIDGIAPEPERADELARRRRKVARGPRGLA
jgi:hypothetical protein